MRNIRDHMYYGEFCAALDFDDGWKDATYPHFKEYISELGETCPEIQIGSHETSQMVHIILTSKQSNPQAIEHILNTSTMLQGGFYCNIVHEYVNPLIARVNPLFPFRLEDPNDSDYYFHRFRLQEMLVQIEKLKTQKEQLLLIQSHIDDSGSSQLNDIEDSLTYIEKFLEKLQGEIPEFVANSYMKLALFGHDHSSSPAKISLPRYTTTPSPVVLDNETIKNLQEFLSRHSGLGGIQPQKEFSDGNIETGDDEIVAYMFEKKSDVTKRINAINARELDGMQLSRDELLHIESIKSEICFPVQKIIRKTMGESDQTTKVRIENYLSTLNLEKFTHSHAPLVSDKVIAFNVTMVQTDDAEYGSEVLLNISRDTHIPCFHEGVKSYYSGDNQYIYLSKNSIDIDVYASSLLHNKLIYQEILEALEKGKKRDFYDNDDIITYFRGNREKIYWSQLPLRQLGKIIASIYRATGEFKSLPKKTRKAFEEKFYTLVPGRLQLEGQKYIELLESLNTQGISRIISYSFQGPPTEITEVMQNGASVTDYKVSNGKLSLPFLKEGESSALQIGHAQQKVLFGSPIDESKMLGVKKYQKYSLKIDTSPIFKPSMFQRLSEKYNIVCTHKEAGYLFFLFTRDGQDILVALKGNMCAKNKSIFHNIDVSLYPIVPRGGSYDSTIFTECFHDVEGIIPRYKE